MSLHLGLTYLLYSSSSSFQLIVNRFFLKTPSIISKVPYKFLYVFLDFLAHAMYAFFVVVGLSLFSVYLFI
jgi:hypothetical protein